MTTSMSDDTLARIKELLAKATPQPWRFDHDWNRIPTIFDSNRSHIAYIEKDKHDDERNANAYLIFELRNNAEALISRLEAAEARAVAAEAERDKYRAALYEIIAEAGNQDGYDIARAALTANPKDAEGEQT